MPAPSGQSLIERLQAEVQEIAEVLSRQSGRSIIEVWNEALSLHRVRYETEIRPDSDNQFFTGDARSPRH